MLQKKNLYNGDFQNITMVFRTGSLIVRLISDEITQLLLLTIYQKFPETLVLELMTTTQNSVRD